MTINTEITDEQANALAQLLRLNSYNDGNDLVAQAAGVAVLEANKRGLIGQIAIEKDAAVVSSAVANWNTIAAVPVPVPPNKVGLVGGGAIEVL